MKLSEAEEIFKVWQHFAYPMHSILHSIFLSNIPESLLPYPKDKLEEALNIVAKRFHDQGDYETSKAIQTNMAMLISYKDDNEALEQYADMVKNPKMREAVIEGMKKRTTEYKEWAINRADNQ